LDKAERTRLKQLANDAVIATFGSDSRESQLAVALERCVDELDERDDRCLICSVCEDHGDHESDKLEVDAGEVLGVHSELVKRLVALKAYHVKLVGEVAGDGPLNESLAEDLAELIEDLESDVDDLESKVIP